MHEYLVGENLMTMDNQQERFSKIMSHLITTNLKWYIAGFVDGEGSFCLNIKKREDIPGGFVIDPTFYVCQHEKNKFVLELIQQIFKTGSIHRKTSPFSVFTYQIAGVRACMEKVIPFFNKYQLRVKAETFNLFRQAVFMLSTKQHKTREGKVKIVEIAYTMNQLGKGKKWNKEEILEKILRD